MREHAQLFPLLVSTVWMHVGGGEAGGAAAAPGAVATAVAASMPTTATPARLYICGRSAVGTRGSGGRP